jgi:hypothetical protein
LAALTYLALGAGALACWAFVTLYTIHYRWWRNQFGRYLVAFSASLGALLTHILVFSIWPDLPWRVPVRTVLFGLVVAVLVHQLFLFLRVIRADRTKPERHVTRGDE